MKNLRIKERERIEAEGSLAERREVLEAISAFSNAWGGTISIGINPSGTVVGVDLGSHTLENLYTDLPRALDE